MRAASGAATVTTSVVPSRPRVVTVNSLRAASTEATRPVSVRRRAASRSRSRVAASSVRLVTIT
jgi:hypothetical protein